MDDFLDVLRLIGILIVGVLAVLGFLFIGKINDFPYKADYYENGIKLDAIEYHNEIYLKKGE